MNASSSSYDLGMNSINFIRLAEYGVRFEDYHNVPQCLRYFTGTTTHSLEAQAMLLADVVFLSGFFFPIFEIADWPVSEQLIIPVGLTHRFTILALLLSKPRTAFAMVGSAGAPSFHSFYVCSVAPYLWDRTEPMQEWLQDKLSPLPPGNSGRNRRRPIATISGLVFWWLIVVSGWVVCRLFVGLPMPSRSTTYCEGHQKRGKTSKI